MRKTDYDFVRRDKAQRAQVKKQEVEELPEEETIPAKKPGSLFGNATKGKIPATVPKSLKTGSTFKKTEEDSEE